MATENLTSPALGTPVAHQPVDFRDTGRGIMTKVARLVGIKPKDSSRHARAAISVSNPRPAVPSKVDVSFAEKNSVAPSEEEERSLY